MAKRFERFGESGALPDTVFERLVENKTAQTMPPFDPAFGNQPVDCPPQGVAVDAKALGEGCLGRQGVGRTVQSADFSL